MCVSLDAGDRSLLIICGALLVAFTLAGVLLTPVTSSGPPSIPSTYSTRSEGAKAAYDLLKELGYRAQRWVSPPTQLPRNARHAILILADPYVRPSGEEKTAIQWFVRRGGRVIATGPRAATLLGLPGMVHAENPELEWGKFSAQAVGPLSRRAPDVLMKPTVRWKGGSPEDLAYYGDRKGGTVVRFPLGRGVIIWWADSSPLSNYGLTQASNLNLLLNSLGSAKDASILWDEYFHGEREGLWTYLAKTPLPWAMLQAALLAIAVVLTYSRRSAPLAVAAAESRLSPMEFVETVGDLYARKHAAAGAVEIALHRFRLLLARRLGTASATASENLGGRFSDQLGRETPGILQVLSQCELAVKSGMSDEARALKLVQELHDYTRRLRLAGPGD